MLSWRTVYFITIGLRFVFALSDSYIHPDEHFQSLQVLGSKILGFNTNLPWEFTSEEPARSLGPLYLIYGPLLYILKWINANPMQIWYLLRLQIVLINWVITDICIYRIMPTKPERIKAVLFILTSYVTLTYQSHLFSNSIETTVLLMCVTIIEDMRHLTDIKRRASWKTVFSLGALVAFGLFNRITFPSFLVIPSWFVLKYILRNKTQLFPLVAGFVIPAAVFVIIDTLSFNGNSFLSIPTLENFVITPLNNLIYNTKYENLASHGIHPRYTHLLVNLPQILGPSGLIFIAFFNWKENYARTTPFLSVISGLMVLSLFPHQELRFLIPLVPLMCCCFDLKKFKGSIPAKQPNATGSTESEKTSESPADSVQKSTLVSTLMLLWYAFNAAMAVLMGIYHQGGVIPALEFFRQNTTEPSVQVWWRTYSPPNWFMGNISTSVFTLNDENFSYDLDLTSDNCIVDTMGSDIEKVYTLIENIKKKNSHKVFLVTPIASSKYFGSKKSHFNQSTHLDMDHLEFPSIVPGIGIYELI